MMGEIALVALVGGALSLDRTAVGQVMVAQPVVTGPIVAALFGDAALGLTMGALVQLLWMGALPIGARVVQNETAAAVVGTAAAALGGPAGEAHHPTRVTVALLAALVAGNAGRYVEIWMKQRARRLAERADWAAVLGDPTALARAHLRGLAWHAVAGVSFLFVATAAAVFGTRALVPLVPIAWSGTWGVALGLVPVIGVGAIFTNVTSRWAPAILAGVSALGAGVWYVAGGAR